MSGDTSVDILAGLLASYRSEVGQIASATDFKACARRILSAGFKMSSAPHDLTQDQRIYGLEQRIAKIEGWMGPIGRLPE